MCRVTRAMIASTSIGSSSPICPPRLGLVSEAACVEMEDAEVVGEEQAVELAVLEHARDVLVPLGVEEVVVALRVAPHAVVMTRRPGLQKRHEVHPPL